MPINMPGSLSRTATFELVDTLFSEYPDQALRHIDRALEEGSVQNGLEVLIEEGDISRYADKLLAEAGVGDARLWKEWAIEHVSKHWLGRDDGPTGRFGYFRHTPDVPFDQKRRTLLLVYREACRLVSEARQRGEPKEIVSLNLCAGDHFQTFCTDQGNRVICIIVTGHLERRVVPRTPADLEPEGVLAHAAEGDFLAIRERYRSQLEVEIPHVGGVTSYVPMRLKLGVIDVEPHTE